MCTLGDRDRTIRTSLRWRQWAFRLVAVVSAPLLMLGLAEGVLRLSGVGHPTAFTLPATIQGVPSRRDNPRFSWTYFPPQIARSAPSFAFPVKKDRDTVRVFVLGASAAQGDPDPSYGFPRILEVMLEERHPGLRLETVNTAITAINSHVVRSIADDLVRRNPDVFVVYLGNNEVVGPFGPGTVLAGMHRSRAVIRTRIALGRLRLTQGVFGAIASLRGRRLEAWRGMEMFLERIVPSEDPRLDTVYRHFEKNLQEIVDQGLDSGASVVLCTVGVNLRDCAPFASKHGSGLEEDARIVFDRAYGEGLLAEESGDWRTALERYAEAEAIDDAWADLHFRWGRVLLEMGRAPEAARRLRRALELDALRFRADRAVNEVVRRVARSFGERSVRLSDAESALEAAARDALPGADLFDDHVHLNFRANWIVARTVLAEVESLLPGRKAATDTPVPDVESCARALAHTAFDRRRIVVAMLARHRKPPFTAQSNHQVDVARLDGERSRLDRVLAEEGSEHAVAIYREAVARRPDDPWLHHNFGLLLQAQGQHDAAAEEFEAFANVLPHDVPGRERWSSALASAGRFREAVEVCDALIREHPEFTPPRYTRAYALARLGRFEDSLAAYRRLLRLDPEEEERIWTEIGKILDSLGREADAREAFRRAAETASPGPTR